MTARRVTVNEAALDALGEAFNEVSRSVRCREDAEQILKLGKLMLALDPRAQVFNITIDPPQPRLVPVRMPCRRCGS